MRSHFTLSVLVYLSLPSALTVAFAIDHGKNAGCKSEGAANFAALQPDHALVRYGATALRHSASVLATGFSSDGASLVSVGAAGDVCVWCTSTGKLLLRADLQNNKLVGAVISVTGTLVAAAGENGTVVVWNRLQPKNRIKHRFPSREITAVALSPDERFLASGSADGAISFAPLSLPTRVESLVNNPSPVSALAFMDNRKLLVGDMEGNTFLCDLDRLHERQKFAGPKAMVSGLSVSKDKRYAAVAYGLRQLPDLLRSNDGVRVWSIEKVKTAFVPPNQSRSSGVVAFSPDQKLLAAAGLDGWLKVWGTCTDFQVRELALAGPRITAVAFSPDSRRIVSGDEFGRLRMWDIASEGKLLVSPGHEGPVTCVTFSNDGSMVATAGSDESIRVWGTTSGREMRNFHTGSLPGNAICFWPGDKIIMCSGRCRAWDMQTGWKIKPFIRDYSTGVFGLALSDEGKFLAVGREDNAVGLWLTDSVKLDRSTLASDEIVYGSPKGPYQVVSGYKGVVNSIAISRSGRFLAIGTGIDPLLVGRVPEATFSRIVLWDQQKRKAIRDFVGHNKSVRDVVFSPDETCIISTSDDMTIRLWDVKTGAQSGSIGGTSVKASRIALSPDGQTLASCGDQGKIVLWEVTSARERLQLAGHLGGVNCVAFSRDGRRVLTGGEDGTAILWDVTGQVMTDNASGARSESLEELWRLLAAPDAAIAYRASWRFCSKSDAATAFIDEHVRMAVAADRSHIDGLLATLSSNDFGSRERAMQELKGLGDPVFGQLRRRLEDKISSDERRLIERLLVGSAFVTDANRLRELRAIETLEQIGTEKAVGVLEKLGSGYDGSRLTIAAKTALGRVRKDTRAGSP